MSLRRTTALAVIFAACFSTATLAQEARHDVDQAGIDKTVKPGDDFYKYANGAWIATAEIPADRSSYGPAATLNEKTAVQVRDLIEQAASDDVGPGPLGDVILFYTGYLDDATIEARGLTPLQGDFAAVNAIADKAALSAYLGGTLRADVDSLNATDFYTDNIFGLWAQQGFEDPDHVVPYLLQGGLGMPDRDYYLDPSPKMAEFRVKYQAHVAKLLTLAGIANADGKAARVMALETAMAGTHASRLDSIDVQKANNPWTRADFDSKAPGLDWKAYFRAASLDGQARFIIWHPSAVTGISALVASQPLDVWKDYLTVRLLDHYSAVLPKAYADENFDFYGRTLTGTPQIRERWKRALDATNLAIGEEVGQIYVAKYFPPQAKARIQALVDAEVAAYHTRMENLTWMSPATKQKALAKLATLRVGVGYPDRWTDYSGLELKPGDALGNIKRAELYNYRLSLAKLGKTPDHGEWVMTPQTVDAVNLPMANALNFPAAILQPPYFDAEADAAYNYGAIGSVIGHEISHSFDDQGAQFDAEGRLSNWWTPEDLAHFQAAGEALAKQYDAYCPFTDLCLNGHQVLSENIADVAGLSAAHDAYMLSLGGKPDAVKNGLTGDQRFFLAFAQSWRIKMREAAVRQRVLTNGHALHEYRGDTVRNLDAWYAAFNVQPTEKLYLKPEDRVKVW